MAVTVENLTKIYGKGDTEVKALDGISEKFEKGEFAAVVGASGSGKTTLLHLLGGLDIPTSGTVKFDETDIYKLSDKGLSEIRRKKIGFVFQFFNLIPELTAKENIILPVLLDNKKPDENYISELSKMLGISDRLTHFPSQMSGGQQQRTAIARALANDPEILLCDEPTGNLDEKSGKAVIELLRETRRKFDKTVVIVTHDLKIADQADRIIKISDGKIA